MLGGLLLMLPGLVSDAVGLLLLFPPVRAALEPVRGADPGAPDARPRRPAPSGTPSSRPACTGPDGKVVQGEVIQGRRAARRARSAPGRRSR